MSRYLVWIQGLRGPEAQIWEEVSDSKGTLKPNLACHVIADDDSRSLDQLKKDFKYETI